MQGHLSTKESTDPTRIKTYTYICKHLALRKMISLDSYESVRKVDFKDRDMQRFLEVLVRRTFFPTSQMCDYDLISLNGNCPTDMIHIKRA